MSIEQLQKQLTSAIDLLHATQNKLKDMKLAEPEPAPESAFQELMRKQLLAEYPSANYSTKKWSWFEANYPLTIRRHRFTYNATLDLARSAAREVNMMSKKVPYPVTQVITNIEALKEPTPE